MFQVELCNSSPYCRGFKVSYDIKPRACPAEIGMTWFLSKDLFPNIQDSPPIIGSWSKQKIEPVVLRMCQLVSQRVIYAFHWRNRPFIDHSIDHSLVYPFARQAVRRGPLILLDH